MMCADGNVTHTVCMEKLVAASSRMFIFCVDGVQTRIPEAEKVLLCTTTNKAIDSLAEKIYNCGHRNILAFGNESRLGATSLKLTLPRRVAAHASVRSVQALDNAVVKARGAWNAVKAEAKDAAGKTDGADYDAILESGINKHTAQLQSHLVGACDALDRFKSLPQHPEPFKQLIQGALSLTIHWDCFSTSRTHDLPKPAILVWLWFHVSRTAAIVIFLFHQASQS
jgi:hypothetical protein